MAHHEDGEKLVLQALLRGSTLEETEANEKTLAWQLASRFHFEGRKKTYGTNTERSLTPDITPCPPVLLPHIPNDNGKLLPQRCCKLCVLCFDLNLTLLS